MVVNSSDQAFGSKHKMLQLLAYVASSLNTIGMQGVVTRIGAILTAATSLVIPYIVEMGVAHHVAPYTTEKSQWISA